MKNFIPLVLFLLCSIYSLSQNAKITEAPRSLKTYPFNDPDPVPILTDNPKIYPYFKYEGYSHEAKNQDWNVVTLSNDYVDVYVLPEVGGKVWGAIEKSTGEEFIYRNEVMKFRNISMRGPWTSGGIEFNFGIIGHHPSTATPVDYVLQENPDGSVTCTVGNIDLPSRTQWRVKIHLPKGKAVFETEALWYNPTPMNQAYYNWMTAAAPARSDFEFYTPGDELLKHSGQALPWPIDDMGRNLALYKENNFGPSKSYHVVGEYNDFFGGYYHEAKYGFGHWGEYDEIPGQKLWLWALSRSGGIWDALLTDTDGQYIEFQAGRQFLQYSPGEVNPQTQANFEPYSADQWREVWFPVKEIGGLTDVSEDAVMNVNSENGKVKIGINTFIKCNAQLLIESDGKVLHEAPLQLEPLQVFNQSFDLKGAKDFEIKVDALKLHYTSDPDDLLIERPFHSGDLPKVSSVEKLYKEGWEDVKFRLFEEAKKKFAKVVLEDPYHIDAMIGLGELYYRQGLYDKGLEFANKALRLDTYHAGANYIAGILYRGKGDLLNAKEALGWAARSMEFRSNAFAQIAEILIAEKDFAKAKKYADKALAFNQYNINAWQVMAVAARKSNNSKGAKSANGKILEIDPLNHFARFEQYLSALLKTDLEQFQQSHRSELAYQTYLELAIGYYNIGLRDEAIKVLDLAPKHPMVSLWWTYLRKDKDAKYLQGITATSPALVFPFRRESLAALQWASKEHNHWKLNYYQALNLWGKDRKKEAADLLKALGNQPDYAPFYMARADLLKKMDGTDPQDDLQRAHQLNKEDWRTWQANIQHAIQKKKWQKAESLSKQALLQFPDNYAIGMDYAKVLNQQKRFAESIATLNGLKVLPFEGASAGRSLYEAAHHGRALELIERKDYQSAIAVLKKAKQWPENLGVGKPFDPDERIADYLLAHCHANIGNKEAALELRKHIVKFSEANSNNASLNHLLGLKSKIQMTNGLDVKVLLQNLLNAKHGQTILTQWVAAYLTNNKRKASQLERENEMTDNAKFKLIKRIAELK